MKRLRAWSRTAQPQLQALEDRGGAALDSVAAAVAKIVRDVRSKGDKALLGFAKKFDGLEIDPKQGLGQLRVSRTEMAQAWETTPAPMREALEKAAEQIRNFAVSQLPATWSETSDEGLLTGQLVRPLGAVACYVPSGRHPLPSTLLMTAIPAQVAGVQRIVVFSAKPAKETLAAAHLLEIEEFHRIGGAQAIAAAAYGSETIRKVDKIAGPGNLYVTAAKRAVSFDCAIDMLAGPTEIIVTSEKGEAAGIASDLVAQAEHDPEAVALLITTNEVLAKAVEAEVKLRVKSNETARTALERNGYVVLTKTVEAARELTNRLAPEHLTIDSAADMDWVQNAGSVFIGKWSAQAMGDYISGPNHTLPTGGQAKVRGGLSVNDFVKLITVQQYDRKAMQELGPKAALLAEAEGLVGHAEAIRVRLNTRGRRG